MGFAKLDFNLHYVVGMCFNSISWKSLAFKSATVALLFCAILFVPVTGFCDLAEYSVVLQGISDNGIYKECKKVSKTFQKKDNPPASLFLLRQRARKDIPGILNILKSYSYFGAEVTYQVKGKNKDPRVVFKVDSGPVYRIREVKIQILPDDKTLPKQKIPSADSIGLRGGEAEASRVRSSKSKIANYFQRQGYVFVSQDKPRLMVDHSSNSVDVVFRVKPGPMARYGKTKIKGLDTVQESYVRNKIPWKRGEKYHPGDVAKLKRKLMATDLFSLIQVNHPEKLGYSGLLPMRIDLEERSHRSIGMGLGYETDAGIKGTVFWENRNFAGKGEKMRYSGEVSEYIQEIVGRYRIPAFLRPDQSLTYQVSLKNEDAEAYDSTGGETSVGVERQIIDNLTLGSGISYKGVRLKDNYGSRDFHLLSLPSFLVWDSRDDPLNPSSGELVNLKLTPFDKISDVTISFLKTILSVKKYQQLPWITEPTLAWRGKIGSISHESAREIPADELFYVGGGGSIRGYPYKEIAPGEKGDLRGGLSMLETSMEVRQNIVESMGIVMFLDGGGAYEDRVPDVEESFYWGAGLGFRYYTQVGPLRFDIAFPLDRENNRFRAYRVYISVGQSF